MAITVTLQAASNATMTTSGLSGGVPLADYDLRKVYGLPNQYVDNGGRLRFVKDPRWDTVNAPSSAISLKRVQGQTDVMQGIEEHLAVTQNGASWTLTGQRRPTTTAFQLRCDSISHDVSDNSTISPMPAFNNRDGTKADTSTPGQQNNLVVAFGMRMEVIKLAGVLFDEGPISVTNPRKQVLMNIARLQYLKTGRGGHQSWGGSNSGPLNPNSYTCLTIYNANLGTYGTFDSIGFQPNGLDLVYRGLIKSISFRQEGGRPNQWFWTMEFAVLANEHTQQNFQGQGLLAGILEIDRIRLVDAAGTPIAGGDFPTTAFIELRTIAELRVQVGANPPLYKFPPNYQAIMISSSDSIPSINGRYIINNIDTNASTFILHSVLDGGGGFNEPILSQVWAAFTNGTQAYVSFGADGGGKAVLVSSNFALPSADVDFALGDDPNNYPDLT